MTTLLAVYGTQGCGVVAETAEATYYDSSQTWQSVLDTCNPVEIVLDSPNAQVEHWADTHGVRVVHRKGNYTSAMDLAIDYLRHGLGLTGGYTQCVDGTMRKCLVRRDLPGPHFTPP
jgi:hypothetical protein